MLITHGLLVTMAAPNRIVEDGAVLVRGGLIADLGATPDLLARYGSQETEVIDCRVFSADTQRAASKLILPGNICAHTHFYGAFARGMAVPGEPARNFVEILQRLWWRLDRALDPEAVRYSALVCLIDAIRHGTTTLIDHHASPNAIEGSLDVVARAVEESGLRAALCYEVTDRNGPGGALAGIVENIRFAQRMAGRPDSLVQAAVGIHASFTVGNATLDACVDAACGVGVPLHLHVAEDGADQEDALRRYGLRVVDRLASRGALSDKTLCAHCVHVDEHEVDGLADSGAAVVHNPRSNMNNAVGAASVGRMLSRGVLVGLGNDGFSNDAFAEMKVVDGLHKFVLGDPRAVCADQIINIAYANSARIARLFWPKATGTLDIGAPADLILMDYRPYTPITAGNLPWHMLFGMDGGMVTDTLCAGRVLMRDRRITTLDEVEICARAAESAQKVWHRVARM